MSKSKFIKSRVSKSTAAEMKLYELSHSLVIHEAQAQWNVANIFLVANAVLAGFIGTNLNNYSDKSNIVSPILSILPIVGIIICLLWLLSLIRTSNYYRFRMAQASQREPSGWMLFSGDGKEISRGKTISMRRTQLDTGADRNIFYNEDFNLGKVGWVTFPWTISNLSIIFLLCITFVTFYGYVIFLASNEHSSPNLGIHSSSTYLPYPTSLFKHN